MAQAKTLYSARLRLEPFGPKHIGPRYLGWLNDPSVVRYSRQRHMSHSEETCFAFLKSFEDTPNLFWALIGTEGIGHIGNVTAEIDWRDCVGTINIMIGDTSVWGKGYGLEAFNAVEGHLVKDLGIRKLIAGTLATNGAMLKVLEKGGYTIKTILHKHELWEGTLVDKVIAVKYPDFKDPAQ